MYILVPSELNFTLSKPTPVLLGVAIPLAAALIIVVISYGVDKLCTLTVELDLVTSLLPSSTNPCNPSYEFIEISRVFFMLIGDTVISGAHAGPAIGVTASGRSPFKL